jgi:hypothetical protein
MRETFSGGLTSTSDTNEEPCAWSAELDMTTLMLAPNPSADIITLNGPTDGTRDLYIFHATGRTVQQHRPISSGPALALPLTGKAEGGTICASVMRPGTGSVYLCSNAYPPRTQRLTLCAPSLEAGKVRLATP